MHQFHGKVGQGGLQFLKRGLRRPRLDFLRLFNQRAYPIGLGALLAGIVDTLDHLGPASFR